MGARSKGCSEIGSDTRLDNAESRHAHASLGYREVAELVHFAKRLGQRAAESAAASAPDAVISLRPIDASNVRAVCDLSVGLHQRGFVASNAVSLAQAYATPEAWPRAVYAEEDPVGFAMLHADEPKRTYYLWRFMIDVRHQGKGFGRRAMELVEEHVMSRPGGDRVFLSFVPAPGSPEGFYRRHGYAETGAVHGGEREMAKLLR